MYQGRSRGRVCRSETTKVDTAKGTVPRTCFGPLSSVVHEIFRLSRQVTWTFMRCPITSRRSKMETVCHDQMSMPNMSYIQESRATRSSPTIYRLMKASVSAPLSLELVLGRLLALRVHLLLALSFGSLLPALWYLLPTATIIVLAFSSFGMPIFPGVTINLRVC